jgi:hypothetical protein
MAMASWQRKQGEQLIANMKVERNPFTIPGVPLCCTHAIIILKHVEAKMEIYGLIAKHKAEFKLFRFE